MKLSLDIGLAFAYKSTSQKIRITSEAWAAQHIFCPNCGNQKLGKYANNAPVADFYCELCREDYELKSKSGATGNKIVDGAYKTMVKRLRSATNPNFFLLNYNLKSYQVSNFLVIPKHFFIPEIIEKRRPLSPSAERAEWVGCNILMQSIPQSGKIYYVRQGVAEKQKSVLAQWKKTLFLRDEKELRAKGWLLDTMRCIEMLTQKKFALQDIYAFENELSRKYPNNKYIKDKLRQQLQILRDRGYLEFLGKGEYRLI